MSIPVRRRISHTAIGSRAVPQSVFNSILEAQWIGRPAKERRYGIALSGGCDSMALTSLCAALHRHDSRFKFTAFIIDHAARPESRAEANKVQNIVLSKLGTRLVETKVLRLDWSRENISDPLGHAGFETVARRLRYRALTAACLSRDIRILLTGHHSDDDVETVLFRLANGYTNSGLAGIRAGPSDVPDVSGVYGCCSGSPRAIDASRAVLKLTSDEPTVTRTVEDGGLQIFRPLLDFDKSALEATCLLNEIRWVEDPTNGNPLMGGRNAVRHILRLGVLPRALQKSSLLRLARAKREEMQRREAVVQRIYDDTSIRLDLATGSVTATFPDDVSRQLLADLPLPTTATGTGEAAYRAALLMRRIILLASPLPNCPLKDMLEPVRLTFPGLSDPTPTSVPTSQTTVAKTLLLLPDATLSPLRVEVHRCRSPRAEVGRESLVVIPEPHTRSGSFEHATSPWRLFDGRFWIRVRYRRFNLGPGQRISVRFLRVRDVDEMRSDPGMGAGAYERLLAALRTRVSVKARYALPALVESHLLRDEGGVGGRRREERVLSLPTLGWSRAGIEGQAMMCEWRYKKIELGKGALHQFIS